MDKKSDYSFAEDITTKIYYIKASGLVYPVMGGALVGILIPLGFAKAASVINKKTKDKSHEDETKTDSGAAAGSDRRFLPDGSRERRRRDPCGAGRNHCGSDGGRFPSAGSRWPGGC